MILVADNLQITDPVIEKAVANRNPEPIRDMVRRCVAAGAEAIDINAGPLTRRPEDTMTFLVSAVRSVCDKPLLLDTVNPKAIRAGLAVAGHGAIINGFSLEPGKRDMILPLARIYNSDIIGYLLYPDCRVPKGETERLSVAVELFSAFQETGLPPERLIIDPVVAPVAWEDGMTQNRAVLSVIRHLPEVLGFPVRTVAGLSNLTTGRGPTGPKRLLEAAFVPMLAAAGLTMLLLNIFHPHTVGIGRAARSLLDGKIFAWEALAPP